MRILLFLAVIYGSFLQAQNTKNVLFIGNSITYYNNMPQTFEAIANSKGDQTSVTMYAPGGTGFINHVNDANVYAKFREKVWDFVVLQPGSNESPGYSETKEATLARLEQLQDSIYKYSPCAKILLYEISYGVWGTSQADLNTYNNTMSLILSNNQYWADNAEVFFAPVGEAFREKWNNDQTDMLWVSTGNIHPNAKGSYIAACVFYASIYQKPSLGTTEISSLSQADATAIQTLVDEKVLNHKPDWRINSWYPYNNFEFQVNGNQVTFTNLSQNVDSVEWDFGDGNSSTNTNPVHQYNQLGQFSVSLTTHKGNCEETTTQQVTISSLSVDDENINNQWKVYPNPVTDYLNINTEKEIENICIFNMKGQEVLSLEKPTKKLNINVLKPGFYIIKAKINGLVTVKKFIKH